MPSGEAGGQEDGKVHRRGTEAQRRTTVRCAGGALRSSDLSNGPHAKREMAGCRGDPLWSPLRSEPPAPGRPRGVAPTALDLERRTPCPAAGRVGARKKIHRRGTEAQRRTTVRCAGGALRSSDLSNGPHAKREMAGCRGDPLWSPLRSEPPAPGRPRGVAPTALDLERRTPCPAGGGCARSLRMGQEGRPIFRNLNNEPM